MKHIYIALLDEGVPCWHPVEVEHQGDDICFIVDVNPDEVWKFQQGESVHCRIHTFSSGQTELVAFEKALPN